MELKAKLNKPFNNKQRCDFIVEQNHKLGFEIRKVKNGLEAWGMTQEEQEEFEEEQRKQQRIAELEEYLKSTDWYAIRFADTGEEIPEDIKKARQDARDEISRLRVNK